MNTQTRHPLRPDMRTLYILIALNVLVFLMQQSGTLPTEAGALWYPQNEAYAPYQWLSHMFLHADLAHLLLNMYAVGMFGRYVLQVWGEKRFLLLYLLCGLAGALLYTGWNEYLIANGVRNVAEQIGLDEATVRSALLSGGLPNVPDGLAMAFYTHLLGASGAVFGVLAAFALCFPDAPLTVMFLPIGRSESRRKSPATEGGRGASAVAATMSRCSLVRGRARMQTSLRAWARGAPLCKATEPFVPGHPAVRGKRGSGPAPNETERNARRCGFSTADWGCTAADRAGV